MSRRTLEIRSDEAGVIWLSGELDLSEATVFPNDAAARLNGQGDVVLECSELTFLDSSGIRAIFQLASKAERGVILRNPTEIVRRVLTIAGVNGQMGVRFDPCD
jgi:anti-anti-sigma factor